MSIETSIVVEFGDDVADAATDVVVVELDDLDEDNNLDSDGELKSSFLPDERPVILIHHANTVVIDSVKCTHGSVAKIGNSQIRTREITTLFTAESSDESLNYASVNSLSSILWFGNSGSLQITDSLITIESGIFPCLAKIEYPVLFQEQWQLIPPSLTLTEDETYEIRIVVYASLIGE